MLTLRLRLSFDTVTVDDGEGLDEAEAEEDVADDEADEDEEEGEVEVERDEGGDSEVERDEGGDAEGERDEGGDAFIVAKVANALEDCAAHSQGLASLSGRTLHGFGAVEPCMNISCMHLVRYKRDISEILSRYDDIVSLQPYTGHTGGHKGRLTGSCGVI